MFVESTQFEPSIQLSPNDSEFQLDFLRFGFNCTIILLINLHLIYFPPTLIVSEILIPSLISRVHSLCVLFSQGDIFPPSSPHAHMPTSLSISATFAARLPIAPHCAIYCVALRTSLCLQYVHFILHYVPMTNAITFFNYISGKPLKVI